MTAWYNENDPHAAQWLRNLVEAGLLPQGDVDERSIADVRGADLDGYDQCHFFAGIGGWPLALALAGWPAEREVWTGSCPCQPLSGAGQRKGHADERHLWPAFHRLIAERGPATVFGEQVAGKDGREWLAAVRADLEGDGYACGAADLSAAGVGAPHIRQRLYWVAQRLADASLLGREPRAGNGGIRRADAGAGAAAEQPGVDCSQGGLADTDDARPQGRRQPGRERAAQRPARAGGVAGGLADTEGRDRWLVFDERRGGGQGSHPQGTKQRHSSGGADGGLADAEVIGHEGQYLRSDGEQTQRIAKSCSLSQRPGPTNGVWRDADWLFCRDGKWRPVEPGTFPLAHGVPGRVGQLRAYGNAIVPQIAAVFIQACMEAAA
jgi:DNA (cytosine-5)-methyltransferase 1